IDYENVNDSYSEWTVNQAVAGQATLTVRYANGTTNNRIMAISVNGNPATSSDFPGTGAWNSWQTQSVNITLGAGSSVIRLASTTSDGGPNVDYIELTGGTGSSSSSSSSS